MSDEHQGSAVQAEADTGLACLVMLARIHNVAASPEQLTHEYLDNGWQFAKPELLLAAKPLDLKAKFVRSTVERLEHTPLPAIAGSPGGRFFIVTRLNDGKALIHDPLVQRPEVLSFEALQARWTGELMLLSSQASLVGELSRFDFTWFIPAIEYRKLPGEVLLASLVLQIFALLTPLFFQAVMDKVLVHRGLTTLDMIAVGLLGIMLFESALRTYVFAHTANRIDVELGSKLFCHLVTLPRVYFQARRVGDSVARVRELEHIRSFLIGNAIILLAQTRGAVLDLQHEAESRATALTQELKKAEQRNKLTRLTAPVYGTVISISNDAIEDEKHGLLYSTPIQLKENAIRVVGKKKSRCRPVWPCGRK